MGILRILPYNSYGLKSSTVHLYELCDIVFLQETLIMSICGIIVIIKIKSLYQI